MLNLRPYGKYIQFGSQLGLSMVLPVLLGYWLDNRYDSSPWFLLAGILLGFCSAIWIVVRLSIEAGREEEAKRRKKADGQDA